MKLKLETFLLLALIGFITVSAWQGKAISPFKSAMSWAYPWWNPQSIKSSFNRAIGSITVSAWQGEEYSWIKSKGRIMSQELSLVVLHTRFISWLQSVLLQYPPGKVRNIQHLISFAIRYCVHNNNIWNLNNLTHSQSVRHDCKHITSTYSLLHHNMFVTLSGTIVRQHEKVQGVLGDILTCHIPGISQLEVHYKDTTCTSSGTVQDSGSISLNCFVDLSDIK